jgi:GNAT superfamily N-acetyltransferase
MSATTPNTTPRTPRRTPPRTTLRPITDADRELLYRIYASTRADEMAAVGWTDEEKERFLRFQFEAQHTHYMQHYPAAAFDVILLDGEAVGRLYVDRRDDEIRLVDIALLPERRGGGLGSAILRGVLAEARDARKPVRIHVERLNPAQRLYRQLGFRPIEDKGVYLLMEWSPDQVKTDS